MSGKVPWVKMTATIGGCEFHPVCHTQGLSSETTQIHHLSSLPPSPPFFRTRRFRSRRGSDERFVDLVGTHYFRNYVRFYVCGKKEGLKLTNPTYISISQP